MRPPDWFQIGPVVPADKLGQVERRVHAKAFGTTVTACGLPAANMQREWDLPFMAHRPDACPDCGRAIAAAASQTPTWTPSTGATTVLHTGKVC